MGVTLIITMLILIFLLFLFGFAVLEHKSKKFSLFTKITFWSVFLSIVICTLNYLGYDDKNILMFAVDPILGEIVYIEPFRQWMTFGGNLTLVAYLFKVLTGFLYGLFLDLIKKSIQISFFSTPKI